VCGEASKGVEGDETDEKSYKKIVRWVSNSNRGRRQEERRKKIVELM